MTQQDDETSQWLKANGLSGIDKQCLTHGITLKVLVGANATDIKDICDEAKIGAVNRVKLKNALKNVKHSTIAADALNNQESEDEKKESTVQPGQCQFSDKYRSHFGRFSLNDDRTILSKPLLTKDISAQARYCCASLDIKPIKSGIHCFRIKMVGKNAWMYVGIHCNISGFAGNMIAAPSYYTILDTKSCGAEILGGEFYRSDTCGKQIPHNWRPKVVSENNCNSAIFDVMITLSNNKQTLCFINVGEEQSNALVFPIWTKNVGWIPHFILYSAMDYPTLKLQVAKIDAKSFGKSLFQI
eukprot:511764_1